ncbi:hypothetical protein SCAR479_06839 [Seiridium cardinale]|uniref:Uncharacterized protein n=1 Tax=Seiridium cardinale TaxID=138064 RepID=A0ABR2XSD3_9PEZI
MARPEPKTDVNYGKGKMASTSSSVTPYRRRELDISGTKVDQKSQFYFARLPYTGDMSLIDEDVMRAKNVVVSNGSLLESGDMTGGEPVRRGSQPLSDDMPDHRSHTPQNRMSLAAPKRPKLTVADPMHRLLSGSQDHKGTMDALVSFMGPGVQRGHISHEGSDMVFMSSSQDNIQGKDRHRRK